MPSDYQPATSIPRLSLDAWAGAAGVTGPEIDTSAITIGIVHFGIGAFHRSHQAVYTEDAAALAAETGWGILGVTGRTDTVVAQLRPQDCLYGVLQKGEHDTSLRIVGSVREVAWPGHDSERVTAVLAAPSTHIATLTITEKGYLRTATGAIDLTLPLVRDDLALVAAELAGHPVTAASRTPIGLLLRGLARRSVTSRAPFTVLPCDNIVHNGQVARGVLMSLAEALDGGADRGRFLAWLDDSVSFASTMVDRIAPAVTDADRAEAMRLTGLRDDALVVAEPFSQWVIEDAFAGPRPAWERVGAIITDDVMPYESVKLRILNATHLLLAYLGALKGIDTIAEVVADGELLAVARDVLDRDILPTLEPAPGMPLEEYRDEVLTRFANPALAHTTRQVAMDGSLKLPVRILGTVADRLAADQVPAGLALVIAAWISYLVSTTRSGGPVLDDPLAGQLQAAVRAPGSLESDDADLVDRILALDAIFPAHIAGSLGFRAAIIDQLPRVRALVAVPEVVER